MYDCNPEIISTTVSGGLRKMLNCDFFYRFKRHSKSNIIESAIL